MLIANFSKNFRKLSKKFIKKTLRQTLQTKAEPNYKQINMSCGIVKVVCSFRQVTGRNVRSIIQIFPKWHNSQPRVVQDLFIIKISEKDW